MLGEQSIKVTGGNLLKANSSRNIITRAHTKSWPQTSFKNIQLGSRTFEGTRTKKSKIKTWCLMGTLHLI